MKSRTKQLESANSVLLVTDNLKIGGVQKVVVRLAEALLKRGVRVGVAASPEGDLWQELPAGCNTYQIPGRNGIYSQIGRARALRNIVKSNKYGIVHSHQRGITLEAKLATTGLTTSIVEHVHNTFLPVTNARASFRGKYLIACGSAIKQMLQDDYKRDPQHIFTILNGVPDPLDGAIAAPVSAKSRNEPIKIIAVGRVSEQKNPHKFIDIIESLNQRQISIQAEWVGDGELLDQCRADVARRDISNLVFSGSHSDVSAKLARSDVLLLTSRWEGLPLVVLEAMSLGIGTILPNVGSCKDAVDPWRNGILYPAEANADEITDLIVGSMDHSVLHSWGSVSRTRYLASFTFDRMVDEVENVYAIANLEMSHR
ncbi:glycosyltransferase [Arthrobacter yangruifuii]|uniref:D-inositol 3-phosphate glycosyltransferase n=1 Tax=Arthrobacter yangruifuii TaxID=2606616 RepID=A0A5N6MHA1_9MICC|nr:glycosyltransferase [Arthrobacter yangruifuii]KAD3515258.1 glycosyltransferase [Arthrobacter yangruifuii]